MFRILEDGCSNLDPGTGYDDSDLLSFSLVPPGKYLQTLKCPEVDHGTSFLCSLHSSLSVILPFYVTFRLYKILCGHYTFSGQLNCLSHKLQGTRARTLFGSVSQIQR